MYVFVDTLINVMLVTEETERYCTFVRLVTWSKKQDVVSRSSAEVEYRAAAHTACKMV